MRFREYLVLFIWFLMSLSNDTCGMDKTDMFQIVSDNREIILQDIEVDDFSRTLDLLSGSRETPQVTRDGECVYFYCYGAGFGSETSYEGFYYVPWDGPAPIGNISAPYTMYFTAEGEEIKDHIEPDGAGWAWYENKVNPGGDNVYYTEKICDNFWYYRLEY